MWEEWVFKNGSAQQRKNYILLVRKRPHDQRYDWKWKIYEGYKTDAYGTIDYRALNAGYVRNWDISCIKETIRA